MIPGKVRGGFFQELILHLQFPGFPFELAQSHALAHGKRRLFTSMLTAVNAQARPDRVIEPYRVPRASVMRPLAASACPSMQWA
jgi:hypothetical protein